MIPVELVDVTDGVSFGWRAWPAVPRVGDVIVIPSTTAGRWAVAWVTWHPDGTIPSTVMNLTRAGIRPGAGLVVVVGVRPGGGVADDDHRRGWVRDAGGGEVQILVDRDLAEYPAVGTEVRW